MGQINDKNGFGALNNRKSATTTTVGNTYGDRREHAKIEGEVTQNWIQKGLQWGRDFFLGNGQKINHLEMFAHKTDRYEGARSSHFSSNPVVDKMRRTEEGYGHRSPHKTQRLAQDSRIPFLDSVIHFFNNKTGPKKA